MEMNEYQEQALRTCMEFKNTRYAILYSALAMGEAGEYQGLVKKWLFHGHPPDTSAMMKELGDVLWAVAQGAKALGCTLDDVAQMNLDKIKRRYPEGFSEERSRDRCP